MKFIFFSSFLLLTILTFSCRHESVHERIARQTSEFSRTSCPKRMDDYTVLDSMVYNSSETTMLYYYSVCDKLDNDSVYNDVFINVFYTDLLNNLKDNLGLLELKKNNVHFKYVYYSSITKKTYMNFMFTADDYK